MKGRDKQPPEVPAADAFYNLFASKPTGSPPAGEPHPNVSLRQKAEAHFRERESQSSEKIEALSPESMRTILHELRVHQIELEMQNEELRAAQAELDASRERYFDLYDLAPVGYVTVSEAGLILEANLTVATLLGLARPALVNQPISRLIFKEDQDIYYKHRQQLFETGDPQECELRMVKQDGSTFWAHLSATAAQDETGAPSCRIAISDITQSKQKEAFRGMDREVLRILSESGDQQDFIRRVVATLKARTGFDAVGIRLQDGEDFPYLMQEGFPKDFLLTENSLVERGADGGLCRDKDGNACLECTCGLVISGKTNPFNPLFTKGGSCWTNDSLPLLRIPADEDPRHNPRNKCIHHGYASIALIPIRTPERITGLIQLNDRRKDRFTLEIVEILEGIAAHIGEGMIRKRAEEDLKETQAILQAALDNSQAGIAIADAPDGRLRYVNKAGLLIQGGSEEEALADIDVEKYVASWHLLDLDGTPLRKEEVPLARAILYGEKSSREFVIHRAENEDRIVWANAAPILDGEGRVKSAIVVFLDITEAKRAQTQIESLHRRNETILNSAAEGIYGVDLAGNTTFVNLAALKLLGYTREELIGKPQHALIHHTRPDGRLYPCEECPVYAAFTDGSVHHVTDEVFWRKDGTSFPVEYFSNPMHDERGVLIGAVATFNDITERKRADANLNDALDRAEAGSRAKSEFLGVMSHELRTPLNGVLGFSELLADTPLNDEQRSFVKTISSSGNHLLAVVNDILDFSSIEHGALAIQAAPFDIAELVESADVAIRQTAADKGIGFRCEVAVGVPEQITGDERRIRQILINLLGNAVKFTSSGSVVFRIAPEAEGRFLEFSIEDTGIGISPETLGRLFKPFTQANSTTSRRFGGTGLGLAISKRLAEAMGGTLTVASEPGKGSTFTLRLPLEISLPSSEPTAPTPGNSASTQPSGALVLVADDEQNSTVLAGKMLQSLGYRIEFAADGAEAVKAFEPEKFFAILMDMAMPVMDGLEATRKIREVETDTGAHVPIIAFTANVMPGDRERCLAAGMDDFLTKPFKRAELAAKLACVAQRQ